MNDIKDGGPAFPATEDHGCNSGVPGMSLRDYLAAKAIPVAAEWESDSPTHFHNDPFPSFDGVAKRAYLLADAMLRAREAS